MIEPAHSKQQVNRGIAWIGLASSLVGILDVAAQIIIVKLFISREDYGVAALALWLFPALDQATDMGLSAAVIQRDDHSVEKISTVFWLNMTMSIVLFVLLLGLAPLYGGWMGHPVVGAMLIAYGGKLIFQNSYFIPAAMLKRELRFKELSLIRIVANVAEFAGKVGFAAAGFKIWCFVLGPLMRVLVTGIGVQLRHPWRPRWQFRPREAAAYAAYGLKTSASQILFSIYTNVDYPIVSKYFGAAALGVYRAAYELVLEPVKTIATVIIDIAFPTFARLRQRRAQLVEQFLSFTRQNLVGVIPVVTVIFLAAPETLTVAWGPAYAAAAPAARILCVVAVLRALSFVVPPLLDGMGYPTLTLTYTAVASLVLPALFMLFAHLLGDSMGYYSVALAWAVGYPLAFIILLHLALGRIGLSPLAYFRRIAGIPGCALLAGVAGGVVSWFSEGLPALVRLLIIAVVTLLSLFVLLAYLQGISPRSVWRAIRANPLPEEGSEGPPV